MPVPTCATAAATTRTVPPDALLVERVAALSDKTALAELTVRHGKTLYAMAYALVFDPEAADAAVASAFDELWRRAGSFNACAGSVGRWLVDLTRRAARNQLRASLETRASGPPDG